MALHGNQTILNKSPGRFLSGTPGMLRSGFNKHGMIRNTYESFSDAAARPYGHLSPSAWVLPKIGGGMSSVNYIQGAGAFAGSGAEGLNAESSILGTGEITTANMQLVVSAIASLVGSGDITGAEMLGKLEAAASLAGSGNLSGAIGALAGMLADLVGSGGVSSATPYATGSMSATLRGYSDLTPEGLRDVVWNAILSQYPTSGTAGNALSLASSGGVDYNALAAAILAAAAADPIAANIKEVNSIAVDGAGTEADPFGPV
jgi:hypothetical protein